MNRTMTMLFGLGAIALGLSASSDAQAELLPMPKMVLVKDGATSLASGDSLAIQNTMSRSFLVYKSQGTFGGINLGWDKNKTVSVTLERQAGAGTIAYGDWIAVKVTSGSDGGYLKYEKRRLGINLGWSKSPSYEWKIAGGTAGAPVPLGQDVQIFNKTENDNLVYCPRVNGAWLKWQRDCSQLDLGSAKVR